VVIDLGTGSGQAVLRRARQDPDKLVIGVDADAAAMADSSRRAAASVRHGGLPNALFLTASAEDLPGPLRGSATLITIALPWGSLLRGLLAADARLIEAVAACLRPKGELQILLSATDRDEAANSTLLDEREAARLASAYESAGLQVVEYRQADESDVARLSSGWGRRLGIPRRRPAWLFRATPGPLSVQPAEQVAPARVPTCRCTRRAAEQACRVSGTGC